MPGPEDEVEIVVKHGLDVCTVLMLPEETVEDLKRRLEGVDCRHVYVQMLYVVDACPKVEVASGPVVSLQRAPVARLQHRSAMV